jgi:hypothetical protein
MPYNEENTIIWNSIHDFVQNFLIGMQLLEFYSALTLKWIIVNTNEKALKISIYIIQANMTSETHYIGESCDIAVEGTII